MGAWALSQAGAVMIAIQERRRGGLA